MNTAKYVLAMYDIRGKQNFIFKKGKIKEVMGASWIIRDLFDDYLYPNAPGKGIFNYKNHNDNRFTPDNFKKHLEEGYIGETIYDGGGNFFVLFRDKETFVNLNKKFTKTLMEKTYTLKVLCTCIEVETELKNFEEDRRKLYEKNRVNEARESVTIPSTVLPFTQVDRVTSLPLSIMHDYKYGDGKKEKVSVESEAKLRKYQEEVRRTESRDIVEFDKMVENKGVDSMLAIIHIDGNNMGAKVQNALIDHKTGKQITTYSGSVERLREFSEKIDKIYISQPLRAIDNKLGRNKRAVIYAGDDFTIICKAKDAFEITKIYFDKINESNNTDVFSSCAGIAIFHSHAPFVDAYRIAEECCDNAKDFMKKNDIKDACLLDFEYLQAGIEGSLNQIREGILCSKPWLYDINNLEHNKLKDKTYVTVKNGDKEYLNQDNIIAAFKNDFNIEDKNEKIGRGNVKGLAQASLDGEVTFGFEIERITAHTKNNRIKELYKQARSDGNEILFRSLVYDCVIFYDQWFLNNSEDTADKNYRGE